MLPTSATQSRRQIKGITDTELPDLTYAQPFGIRVIAWSVTRFTHAKSATGPAGPLFSSRCSGQPNSQAQDFLKRCPFRTYDAGLPGRLSKNSSTARTGIGSRKRAPG